MSDASFRMPSLSFAGLKELRKRLLFSFFALVVYRIGAHIPLPVLDLERLTFLLKQTNSGLMAFLSTISGGSNGFTIFALGLSPYISVSLIFNLLTKTLPSLEKLQKEGELGRRKINQYIRYSTVGLALVRALYSCRTLASGGVVTDANVSFYVVGATTLVAGAVFLMWLGEQITERGIGNGTSVIIFAGIVAGLPHSTMQFIKQVRQEQISLPMAAFVLLMVVGVSCFVVFMERAQRKITVHYPKRQQGRHIYAAQSSHLPLKINMAGIMPPLFASMVMVLPGIFLGWLGFHEVSMRVSPGQPIYILAFALVITFFCFFYTAFEFDPAKLADNLKKSGAFIPGIRPGNHSAQYIDKVMTRLTVIGCFYLLLVVLLPDVIVMSFKILPLAFGGTSLLIVVGVVMEVISQIQSLLMSHQYESLLKKAGLKNNISTL